MHLRTTQRARRAPNGQGVPDGYEGTKHPGRQQVARRTQKKETESHHVARKAQSSDKDVTVATRAAGARREPNSHWSTAQRRANRVALRTSIMP